VPVARSTESRRALLVALTGVVAAVALIALMLFLNADSTDSPSGDAGGPFVVGEVEELLDLGAGESPVCFNDPAAGERPLCIFHTAGDDDEGWVAYDAQVDGAPLAQDRETGVLTDAEGEVIPPDGGDLPRYATDVVGGRLQVDLDRAPGDPDADAPDPSTTTTVRISGNPDSEN
jgi:hypothetical protein